MPTLQYEVVDVFTDVAFAGNPLAVVLDSDGLPTESLQAIAREFNLSETSFPQQPPDGADYRLRIFTPQTELPFAGHPSVGAAWVLARLGRLAPGPVVQDCHAGRLTLDLAADGGPVTLTGAPAQVGEPVDPAPLLAAVGLTAEDLAGPPPRVAGTGLSFAFLSVRPEAIARARPVLDRLANVGAQGGVSVVSVAGELVRSRVFAAGVGIAEDPATGSAALGLGGWLVASGLADPDGESSYVVRQGVEMGRPSTLRCSVVAAGGRVSATRVSGDVVAVARGEIRRP